MDEIRIVGEISSTRSFRELYEAIKQKKEIIGSMIKYKPDDLIDEIEDLREALEEKTINPLTREEIDNFIKKNSGLFLKFTRNEGLRKKIKQLIVLEIIARSKNK